MSGIAFINQKDVLITTNDSRLRIINLDDCIQKVKFKGHLGENLQLQPALNCQENRISLGSENGNIYIFELERTINNLYKEAKPQCYEFFDPYNVSKHDVEERLAEKAAGVNTGSNDMLNFFGDARETMKAISNIALFAPRTCIQHRI